MAHPKRKISKTRRNKRRTNIKAKKSTIATCPTTQMPHLYHRAFEYEGDVYYKGRVIIAGDVYNDDV